MANSVLGPGTVLALARACLRAVEREGSAKKGANQESVSCIAHFLGKTGLLPADGARPDGNRVWVWLQEAAEGYLTATENLVQRAVPREVGRAVELVVWTAWSEAGFPEALEAKRRQQAATRLRRLVLGTPELPPGGEATFEAQVRELGGVLRTKHQQQPPSRKSSHLRRYNR